MAEQLSEIRETVRERYAEAAKVSEAGAQACCGGGSCCGPTDIAQTQEEFANFGAELYSGAEQGELPDAAKLASLGCGNPTAVAELHEGETVLDLGSGGGIDVLLSARRVGADRQGLRARHDRRDARARAAQQARGGTRERRVAQGHDRRGARCRPTQST